MKKVFLTPENPKLYPCNITCLALSKGESFSKGDTLASFASSAGKQKQSIRAPFGGKVDEVYCCNGQRLESRKQLLGISIEESQPSKKPRANRKEFVAFSGLVLSLGFLALILPDSKPTVVEKAESRQYLAAKETVDDQPTVITSSDEQQVVIIDLPRLDAVYFAKYHSGSVNPQTLEEVFPLGSSLHAGVYDAVGEIVASIPVAQVLVPNAGNCRAGNDLDVVEARDTARVLIARWDPPDQESLTGVTRHLNGLWSGAIGQNPVQTLNVIREKVLLRLSLHYFSPENLARDMLARHCTRIFWNNYGEGSKRTSEHFQMPSNSLIELH
jgi:hypothetical protein